MSSKKEVVKNNPKSQSNKSTNDNALTITVTEEQIEFCRYMNTYKALELKIILLLDLGTVDTMLFIRQIEQVV